MTRSEAVIARLLTLDTMTAQDIAMHSSRSQSQVYYTLQRMIDAGTVKNVDGYAEFPKGGPGRAVYRITHFGREQLRRATIGVAA